MTCLVIGQLWPMLFVELNPPLIFRWCGPTNTLSNELQSRKLNCKHQENASWMHERALKKTSNLITMSTFLFFRLMQSYCIKYSSITALLHDIADYILSYKLKLLWGGIFWGSINLVTSEAVTNEIACFIWSHSDWLKKSRQPRQILCINPYWSLQMGFYIIIRGQAPDSEGGEWFGQDIPGGRIFLAFCWRGIDFLTIFTILVYCIVRTINHLKGIQCHNLHRIVFVIHNHFVLLSILQ